jgi:hypothetical protein
MPRSRQSHRAPGASSMRSKIQFRSLVSRAWWSPPQSEMCQYCCKSPQIPSTKFLERNETDYDSLITTAPRPLAKPACAFVTRIQIGSNSKQIKTAAGVQNSEFSAK